jgi:RNA polymerase sigma-70 factor (ECF subfamily)
VEAFATSLPIAAPAQAPAFQALYRAHFDYVWHSLRKLGIREADLADLTHDVFVVVHRKLRSFDATRPAKPWLFGICFRVALDRKRKASSFRESLTDPVDLEKSASEFPAADDVASSRQAHDRVMRALDTLDFDKRAVFVLHELEGMSMPEIAALIDAPLNTLYSRLRLARDAFVAAVRKDTP